MVKPCISNFFDYFKMKYLIPIFLAATIFWYPVSVVQADDNASAAIFYGKLTDTDFVQIPFRSPDLESVQRTVSKVITATYFICFLFLPDIIYKLVLGVRC